MKTTRKIEDRELAEYRSANPWTVISTHCPGWLCSRHPDEASAHRAAFAHGRIVAIDRAAMTVTFDGAAY